PNAQFASRALGRLRYCPGEHCESASLQCPRPYTESVRVRMQGLLSAAARWAVLTGLAINLGIALAADAPKNNPPAERRAIATTARAPAPAPEPRETGPGAFAPIAADHPLASLWNDPEFQRRLIGSYGFDSDVEPRLTAEEQQFYREKILPLLRDDPRKAIPELESRVKPEASALFDFLLGNIHFQHGDTTNAVKWFERAVAKFPSFRRAWKNLGLALARDGKFDAAVGPLTRSIALGDADPRAFGLLGFAHLNAGRFVSAEAAYRQALLLEPDNLDFQLGLVKSLVAQADYDSALALLDELLRKHPERDALWSVQANVYLQKNELVKAAVNFEVLRRLDKATADNLFTLGDIYLSLEARELALDAYRAALEKDAWQRPAKALRAAELLTARGAYAEAKSFCERIRAVAAGKLAPDDELKLLKQEAKVALATGSGEDAIKVLEQIIARNPLDGEALLLAGDYYARAGEPEKAEFRYDAAAKLPGFEADAYVKHAQLLVKSGKYALAAEKLRKAQKLKPRDTVQRYLEKVEQLAGRS
ncbi:MAG: tetratricopeptide repeat protein, partial [Verrucomicrobiales bacterium]|nr:tetratricopeptide repeat protein [Verrucomicrobiales bacterium]